MNECNIKCPFVSGDNKYDVLINQLNREIEVIKKTTTAKSLLYENKLNELCVYIKNNLSNELRLLFDSMKVSGELEEIITETIMQDLEVVVKKTAGYVTPQQFGAMGNALCNDTCALQKCFNSDKEIVLNGNYVINKELVITNDKKITCHNATITLSNHFNGECAIRVVDGAGDGIISNLSIDGNGNNVVGVLVENSKHLTIENLHTIRCYAGGLVVKSGYECMVRGFNLIYDDAENIRAIAPQDVCGLKVMTSDCEIVQGNCVNYPIGCYLHANNRATNVHCWGMPHSLNTSYKGGYMLIGFVCVDKQNTLTGCVADTPTLMVLSEDPSVTNGGIGFLDANTDFLNHAYPSDNKYIGCNVTIHNESISKSVICFHIGDKTNNSSANTVIIPVSACGNLTALKERVKIVNEKLGHNCCIIGNYFDKTDITTLGWQKTVCTNEQTFARSDYSGMQLNEKVATTKKHYVKLTANEDIQLAENVSWLHIDNIFIAGAVYGINSMEGGRVDLEGNTTMSRALVENNNFLVATVHSYIGELKLYIKRVGDTYYLHQDGDVTYDIWLIIEETHGFHVN